jgi:hypothetical protein
MEGARLASILIESARNVPDNLIYLPCHEYWRAVIFATPYVVLAISEYVGGSLLMDKEYGTY